MDYQSLQPVARRLIVLAASSLRLLIALVSLLLVFTASARTYTVKSGDTLQRIAQRELGSANRWQEIARANNLPAPHTIRLGQHLNLPDSQGGMIPLAPPTPTNAPAPPSPVIPPGNAVPLDPFNTTSVPLSEDLPPLDFPTSLWWSIPVGFLVGLLFYALNLRISCWFSLVETTYFRCFKLSLYLLLLGVACLLTILLIWLAIAAVGFAAKFEPWSMSAILATSPFAFGAWFLLSIIVIKRTLDCKWRSVVTILTMSSFVTWLLTVIILASTLSLGAIASMLIK